MPDLSTQNTATDFSQLTTPSRARYEIELPAITNTSLTLSKLSDAPYTIKGANNVALTIPKGELAKYARVLDGIDFMTKSNDLIKLFYITKIDNTKITNETLGEGMNSKKFLANYFGISKSLLTVYTRIGNFLMSKTEPKPIFPELSNYTQSQLQEMLPFFTDLTPTNSTEEEIAQAQTRLRQFIIDGNINHFMTTKEIRKRVIKELKSIDVTEELPTEAEQSINPPTDDSAPANIDTPLATSPDAQKSAEPTKQQKSSTKTKPTQTDLETYSNKIVSIKQRINGLLEYFNSDGTLVEGIPNITTNLYSALKDLLSNINI